MNMKRVISILIIFITATASSQDQLKIDSLNIVIKFTITTNTFPESWNESPINATAIPLDSIEKQRSIDIIYKALKKYPAAVIQENLKTIYIFKSIAFYGQEYGGTNSVDAVYMANSGVVNGYSNYYIEKSFHHEFSSILFRNYPHYFKENKWKRTNKLQYGNGGVQALIDGEVGQTIDSIYNANGFLHQYAMSDIENDFNSFAENLFVPTASFSEAVQLFPRLNKKLEIIIAFYRRVDATFSKKYFDELKRNYLENNF